MSLRTPRSAGLGLLALLALAGCGGSSSSSPLSNPTEPSSPVNAATTSSVTAAQGAQSFTTIQTLSGLASLTTGAVAMGKTRDPLYSSSLGLYYTITPLGLTSVRLNFSSNADGTGDTAGTMTLSLTSSDATTVHETYDVTSHGTRVKGTTDVQLDGNNSAVHATGAYTSTNPTVSGTFDLTYAGTDVTGRDSVTVEGRTVTFTNIVASTETGAFAADYAANGLTGHITRNANGSGSVTTDTSAGVVTLTWTIDGTATIHFPDGSEKNLGKLANL